MARQSGITPFADMFQVKFGDACLDGDGANFVAEATLLANRKTTDRPWSASQRRCRVHRVSLVYKHVSEAFMAWAVCGLVNIALSLKEGASS